MARWCVYYSRINKKTNAKTNSNINVTANSESAAKSDAKGKIQSQYPDCKILITSCKQTG